MDENTAKVICFLGLIVFLLVLYIIHRTATLPPDPGDKTITQIVDDVKQAGKWKQKFEVLFANLPALAPILMRKGFLAFLATVAVAGFGALAALFGFGSEELNIIRCMLIDAYSAILSKVNPGCSLPTPCPLPNK
jgi:hypothetical protein